MPLNTKELKLTKSKWENFRTIIKIIELNEINKLRKMMSIYNNNLIYFHEQKQLIQTIEKQLSIKKATKFFENETNEQNDSSALYIVMSPEKNDSISQLMMNKTKDYLQTLDMDNSYFVSFGYEANKLLNRLEVKIVDSFKQFNNGILEDKSIDNIVAIASLSKIHLIFDNVFIVFPEVNHETGELFVTKILPFSNNNKEFIEDLSKSEEDVSEKTSLFFEINKISTVQWFPSVDSVYGNLVESLLRLKINILILKHKINIQKEVVAQTKEKSNKITEYLDELLILIQRGRKEEITLELLTLSSSFKLLNNDEELSRKIKDEEERKDLLWKKEVQRITRTEK